MNSADTIKKGLDALKMCHDLMVFNPATGEEIDPSFMNADNRNLYYGIETVIAHIQQLESELESVRRERDAALADMKRYTNCQACKRWEESMAGKCTMKDDCLFGTIGRFEWRGVCPENTEVQGDAETR